MNFIGPFSDYPWYRLNELPRYRPGAPVDIRKIATTRGLPIALADVKEDLRIDSDDEDQTVIRMIRGAATFLERRTGIAFLAGRYEANFDDWFQYGPWEFQRFPYRTLVEVAYFDRSTSPQGWTQVPLDELFVSERSASFIMTAHNTFIGPAICAPMNGVRVRFDAGFDPLFESGVSDSGDGVSEGEDDTPRPIEDDARSLLTACVAHFYENRELFAADKIAAIEASAGSLFTSRRKFW